MYVNFVQHERETKTKWTKTECKFSFTTFPLNKNKTKQNKEMYDFFVFKWQLAPPKEAAAQKWFRVLSDKETGICSLLSYH